MYRKRTKVLTTLRVREVQSGERLETKIERLTTGGGAGIEESVGIIYQEGSNRIEPAYNIRTDRMEIAMKANDKVAGSLRAKSAEKHQAKILKMKGESDNAEPSNSTDTNPT